MKYKHMIKKALLKNKDICKYLLYYKLKRQIKFH